MSALQIILGVLLIISFHFDYRGRFITGKPFDRPVWSDRRRCGNLLWQE